MSRPAAVRCPAPSGWIPVIRPLRLSLLRPRVDVCRPKPGGAARGRCVRAKVVFAVLLSVAASTAPGWGATAAVPLATYRAVHDFTLDPKSSDPSVGDMTGRMVTEFKGSECAGYTTTTRFVTRGTDDNDQDQLIDTRNVAVENNNGTFTFDNETYENGKQTEVVKGTATRGADGVQVRLKQPDRKTVSLPSGALFPTEQTARVIEAAEAGQRLINIDTYDASDDGDTDSPATVAIGPAINDPSDVGDEAPIADAGFATMTHWPITVSYFDPDNGSDQTPNYAMSALLYENGLMRRLRLDYGNFVLVGTLVQLDMLTAAKCTN
ncbi:MAG TPA: cell envelope integrity EipB family protein [Bauldia sp.]|nr:cell envelope integrity EipB family protein [Bauldia sp.]